MRGKLVIKRFGVAFRRLRLKKGVFQQLARSRPFPGVQTTHSIEKVQRDGINGLLFQVVPDGLLLCVQVLMVLVAVTVFKRLQPFQLLTAEIFQNNRQKVVLGLGLSEEHSAGQQLVEDAPEAPDVGLLAHCALHPEQLLRRLVRERADWPFLVAA